MKDWPLVGRAPVLRHIRDVLLSADMRAVVVVGAMGVGKTRVVTEALQLAERAGMATVRVSATSARSDIPLAAFASLLPVATEPETGAVDDRAYLLQRCATAIVDRARGRPMVLAVDDAHLLDDVSATLVHQLVAARSARVLVTMRSLENPPEPMIALWKDGLAERIQLDGLTDEAVGEALSWALDGSVDNAAVAELVARAKGNMLFLRELVTGAIAEEALCDDGGVWRLVGDLHPTDRLVELVESRLRGLDEDDRSMMELVSLGEPLTVPELEACADLPAVERIEQKGLVKSRHDAAGRLTVGLAHPVYGDVLRARMSPLRARSVARALADAVEELGSLSDDDTLRVARWRLMSGGAEPSLMLRAATTARWRYDFALAQRLASAAVAAGGGFDAQLLTAELLGLQGRSADAARALAALAAQVSDAGQGARVALARLDNSVIYTGAIDEGLRIADECLATSPPTAMADEVRARRLALLVATDGPRVTVEAAQPLLRETSGRALVWACMPASYSLARTGRVEEALAVADRGYEAHRTLTEPMAWYPWMHRFYRAEALAHAGRFAEAEELSAGEYQEGVRHRSLEGQALFAWQLAKSVADRGDVDAAVRRARMAAAIYRRLGRPQFVHFCLMYLAQALAVGRRPAEAAEVLGSIDQLGVQTGHFMGIDLAQARGWTEAAGGDLRAAAAVFREAAEEGERIGDRVGTAAALHNLARIGRAADVVGWLEDVAVGVEGDLAAARARHARALVNRSGAELDEVSLVFDGMGATLLAAEASADAAGTWSTAGERRRSAAAQRRSALLAERCAGADTPALRAVGSRVHLTSGGGGGGRAGGRREVEQGDRRRALRVGPDRREPPARHLLEAGCLGTARSCRGALRCHPEGNYPWRLTRSGS